MQIVIDIPDCTYNEQAKNGIEPYQFFENYVMTGTPLPKGHGRIGDLDALRDEISLWGMNDYEPSDFIDEIDGAPTIIEADKGESEVQDADSD